MIGIGLDMDREATEELEEAEFLWGEKGSLKERPRVKLYLVAVPNRGVRIAPGAMAAGGLVHTYKHMYTCYNTKIYKSKNL